MTDRFGGRKYSLAVFFAIVATVALFTGEIEEETFMILVGGILGLYGYQNIQARKES